MTLKLAIEQAIAKSAPEIESVEAEGANDPVPPAPALLQIEMAGGGATESSNGSMNGPSEAGWTSAGAIPAGAEERGALVEISSQPVLICSVDGAPYAYRPGCPVCDASLEGAALRSGELICPDCEKRFDVRRAGRCLDAPQLHLEPIPLLAGDDGGVKLALGAGVVT
jgi:nitrite reductase/ring-hydroxylating ferredoxin subunit